MAASKKIARKSPAKESVRKAAKKSVKKAAKNSLFNVRTTARNTAPRRKRVVEYKAQEGTPPRPKKVRS
jgi:hypothetical protein